MVPDTDYKPLAAAAAPRATAANPHDWSVLRRSVVVWSAIAACFLNAGLVFGYSAIYQHLLENRAFADTCEPGDTDPCKSQTLALSGMFTLATSALNIMSLPAGALLDVLGPRLMATCMGIATFVGCVSFSGGGPGTGQFLYIFGFTTMAVSGPPMFMSTVSFANLFPGREGLITAALVGCFDASSAVFIGVGDAISSGVSFSDAFIGYGVIPLLCGAVALVSWPRRAVEEAPRDTLDKIDEGLRLAYLPWRRQICTLEYWLLTHSLSAYMLCVNFFIASVNEQVLVAAPREALWLANVFSVLLPLGGIVYIPIVGAVTDRLSVARAWLVLWVSMLVFWGLRQYHFATGCSVAAYMAFAVFAFCRPLLYTLGAASTGQLFGFASFGTVYGLLFTVAGCVNLGVQPLRVLAVQRGFGFSNAVCLLAQVSTLALPVALSLPGRREAPRQEFSPTFSYSPRSRGMSGSL